MSSKLKGIGAVVIIIASLVALSALGWGIQAAFLGPKTVTTQISSAGDIIEKTYDADNAIYNYEWFKQQYADIQAAEKIISNTAEIRNDYIDMYGDPKEWGWQTKADYNSINTKYLGQKNHYETLVEDYNARASMANRNVFQDKLPLHVDKILW